MSQLYLRGQQNQKLSIEKLDGNFIYLQDGIIESKQVDYTEETNSILDCFTESVSTTNGSLDEEILYIKTLPPNFIDNSPINIKAYFTTGALVEFVLVIDTSIKTFLSFGFGSLLSTELSKKV